MTPDNTKPIHHPDTEQLLAYAAGTLTSEHTLCLTAHLEQCHCCSAQFQKMLRIGSEQFQQLSPSPVLPDVKTSVFAAIRQKSKDLAKEPALPSAEISTIPFVLRQWIKSSNFENLPWKRITGSIFIHHLVKHPGKTALALVKVNPGGRMIHHDHSGDEVTVILQGSFSDESGMYQKGDYLYKQHGQHHQPIASKDQSCICLILLDGPILFTGFLSRVLNPLLRLHYRLQSTLIYRKLTSPA